MGLQLHCIPPRIETRRKIKKAEIDKELSKLPDAAIVVPFMVATRKALWENGATISVAFASGSTRVHEAIEKAASTWSRYANLTFDFRDPQTGKFRRWSRNDHRYAADIRIAFKANDGFWSAVGRGSIDCKVFLPNEPSMNYDGFSRELPDDWKAYVLHEFGMPSVCSTSISIRRNPATGVGRMTKATRSSETRTVRPSRTARAGAPAFIRSSVALRTTGAERTSMTISRRLSTARPTISAASTRILS